MASFEFVCPHCSGRFELENPPTGGQAACPLCGGIMAIPAELPREEHPQVEDSAASPNDAGAADPGNEASPEAFDFGELAPWEMLERRRGSAREEQPIFEPLSREERERRRQIRSLAWMIGGAVLLVIAAAVLSRL